MAEGTSWTVPDRHRWPKKGERKLVDAVDRFLEPDDSKPVAELAVGDVVWWDEPGQGGGEHPAEGRVLAFSEELVTCARKRGGLVHVPYEALRTREEGTGRARVKREAARGTGGF